MTMAKEYDSTIVGNGWKITDKETGERVNGGTSFSVNLAVLQSLPVDEYGNVQFAAFLSRAPKRPGKRDADYMCVAKNGATKNAPIKKKAPVQRQDIDNSDL
jgi:hypothetical protein